MYFERRQARPVLAEVLPPRLVSVRESGHDRHMAAMDTPGSNWPGAAPFRTTHWSVVLRAGAQPGSAGDGRRALEELCRAYWPPLYAYVRRQGYSPEDAQDLTQEYFSRLLADQSLASVHESKGRFRSFLLASIKNLLANEWKRATRLKRGGGAAHFSLEEEIATGLGGEELLDPLDPEKAYERRWAETLLQRVLDRLRAEWEHKATTRHFDDLKPFLVDGAIPESWGARKAVWNILKKFGPICVRLACGASWKNNPRLKPADACTANAFLPALCRRQFRYVSPVAAEAALMGTDPANRTTWPRRAFE